MKIVLLGPPGAGKGTQAEKLCKEFNLLHVSTGNLLRAAKANQTKIGLLAAGYMDEGRLVPDNIVISLVEEQLKVTPELLFDGFPRTLQQAKELEDKLSGSSVSLDAVINLVVDDSVVIERLSLRRMCPKCGVIYHLKFKKPNVNGKCSKCQTQIIQRIDDKEETIIERLRVYRQQTKPLEKFYEEKNLLINVVGEGSSDEVFKEVLQKIKEIK